MGANGETLLDPLSTATTVLAGIVGGNGDHSAASVCCFAAQDGAELCPAGIRDALGQVRVADHIRHPQIFERDHVVRSQQGECGLVMEIGALPLHRLMLPGEQLYCFTAAFAALLSTGDAALGFLELSLRPTIVPRILDGLAAGGDEKHLQANVDASLLPCRRKWLYRHAFTGEAHVPAVRFLADGHRLRCTLERTTPPDADTANL
jgi:hypothetical protein